MDLRIDRVSKQYRGGLWGLRDFSLRLGPGVLGLVGPNGAGKSTLMRILATTTRPTQGTVTWNGTDVLRNPDALRQVLGYLPQDFGVYPNLNVVEFLTYLAAVKGLDRRQAKQRIDELVQLLNLAGAAYRPIGSFSGGMRQRVGIAQALLNDPEVLIVDEPTVGLDPEERVRFRHLIAHRSGDRIVLLSTHIVSDVAAVATHIALINEGRLIWHGLPEEMLHTVTGKVWGSVIPGSSLVEVSSKHLVANTTRRADGILVRIVSDTRPCPSAERLPANLEDAYLYFINRCQDDTS